MTTMNSSKRNKVKLYPGHTKINSVRFIDLEKDLCRALINVDRIFLSPEYAGRLMSRKEYHDVERIEITFHSSEREVVDKLIMDRLNGIDWSGLVFFGEDMDYAWTEKAIRIGRPANCKITHSRI